MTSARFGGTQTQAAGYPTVQGLSSRRSHSHVTEAACKGLRGAGKQNNQTQICAWEYRAANGGLLNVLLRWADKADCFNAWLIHGLGWLCLILPAPVLTTARPLSRPA